MSVESQLWYVKVADGTVHPASLEQIDDAFNAGHISADTLVLAAGETRWKRLGELAGLDEAPSQAASSVSPMSVPAPSSAPSSAMPSSLRPLTFDLDVDSDEAAMRPKPRKALLFGGLGVALAIGGVILAVSRAGGGAAPAVAAAAPPPPVVPVADSPAPAASSADSVIPRFSDEQKQKLLAADKAREDQAAAKHSKFHPGSVHRSSHSSGKAQGFTTGGNKYDPMNASF